jgi:hypothetical protein
MRATLLNLQVLLTRIRAMKFTLGLIWVREVSQTCEIAQSFVNIVRFDAIIEILSYM